MNTPNATLDISEARKSISSMDDRLREDPVVYVMRHGKPVFAFVDVEYLSAVLETIEIVSDPETYAQFMQGLEDIKAGRVHDQEDVKRMLQ